MSEARDSSRRPSTSDASGRERSRPPSSVGGGRPDASPPPAIRVDRVTVRFGGLHACDDVSFAVPRGERRAVIGPNGAGKTTLFNAVSGQVAPSEGSVFLHGEDITATPTPDRVRAGLGRTFQITTLMGGMSVWSNAMLAVTGMRPRLRTTFWRPLSRIPEVIEPAEALLRQWELWNVRDRLVDELAYGQQRLLEIVLALASEPTVLLLDEPTAGLSRAEADFMTQVAHDLPPELTLLVIEHDMDVAFAIGEVVQVMTDGSILAVGTPEEVQRNEEVITAYLGGKLDAA